MSADEDIEEALSDAISIYRTNFANFERQGFTAMADRCRGYAVSLLAAVAVCREHESVASQYSEYHAWATDELAAKDAIISQLRGEVERLRAERDLANDAFKIVKATQVAQELLADRLSDENEALQANDARYRFLRDRAENYTTEYDHVEFSWRIGPRTIVVPPSNDAVDTAIDAAIDAAMAKP